MKITPLHMFLPVALFFMLAACAEPGRFAGYKENNPLVVSKTIVSLTISAPLDMRPLSVEDSSSLRGFINDYINRGRTAVTVEMNPRGDDPSLARMAINLLIRAGLRSDEISIRNTGNGALGNDLITLSFSANSVKVPECGKWSGDNDYNWSNRNSGNYGCSYQRNLGLSVADPGDLKKARPQSGRDPSRSDAVIYRYRAGAFGTTGASSTGTSSAGAFSATPTTGASSSGGTTTP